MIGRVVLPEALHRRLAEEAVRALPCECCGLLEGTLEAGVVCVTQVHPTRNLAAAPDRFEIDPAGQIALLKRLRGTGRDIVGCYHSHPNGLAEPSARDREFAFGGDFLWLIVALGPGGPALGAFEIDPEAHRRIPLVPDATEAA